MTTPNRWIGACRTSSITMVMDRLRSVFASWMYTEVSPSLLEAPDGEGRSALLIPADRAPTREGNTQLRSDFTAAIARSIALSERGTPRPVRRSYAGTVFRRSPRSDSLTEVRQAGVELVGAPSPAADAEILCLAAEGLDAIGATGAEIHIGHAGFVRALLRAADLPSEVESQICNQIARHERTALESTLTAAGVSGELMAAIVGLLDLAGNASVIRRARALTDDPVCRATLDELEEIFRLADSPAVMIDLSEVRDLTYYTGIRFEAFAPGIGCPVLGAGGTTGSSACTAIPSRPWDAHSKSSRCPYSARTWTPTPHRACSCASRSTVGQRRRRRPEGFERRDLESHWTRR